MQFELQEKFDVILTESYTRSSRQVRVYRQLAPSFTHSSGVHQGRPTSPNLSNNDMDEFLSADMNVSADLGVELLLSDKLSNFEYADDINILGDSVKAVQNILFHLKIDVSEHGMLFLLINCKVFVKDSSQHLHCITMPIIFRLLTSSFTSEVRYKIMSGLKRLVLDYLGEG